MSIRNRFIMLAMTLMAVSGIAYARINAIDLFVKAPRTVIPLVDGATRMDMVDYFRSGLSTASSNVMDGDARITAMSDSSVTASLSGVSACQIAVLPCGNDTVVAYIGTWLTSQLDSHIEFYTRQWRKLQSDRFFTAPQMADWLTPAGRKHAAEVNEVLPFMLASYEYCPRTGVLTVRNNMADYLGGEAYAAVERYIKPSLSYKWTGKKFKLQ